MNPLANARDMGLIPGPGRPPGEGNDNPLQYSCLENPMDREAWWATVYEVTRVRHDLTTKPPPAAALKNSPSLKGWKALMDFKEKKCPIIFTWSQVYKRFFSIKKLFHLVAIPTLTFQSQRKWRW